MWVNAKHSKAWQMNIWSFGGFRVHTIQGIPPLPARSFSVFPTQMPQHVFTHGTWNETPAAVTLEHLPGPSLTQGLEVGQESAGRCRSWQGVRRGSQGAGDVDVEGSQVIHVGSWVL